jgi:hypothetical protein
METPNPTSGPTPPESFDAEQRVADLTGMTRDAARTFLEFHTGMRWLRRDDRE